MSVTRNRILNAALALAATLVTLYAIETILTVARPSWIDKLGTALRRGPDTVSETTLLRDHGIRAYPYLQPDTFTDSIHSGLGIGGDTTVVPLAGIPGQLTVLCREDGPTIGYRSDSLGFRNANTAWIPAQLDVAIIGDSFAQGFCRTENETIAGRLRAAGLRTVTVGLAGAGPLAELGTLKEYVAPARPKIVFWLFYEGNDLVDIASERTTTLVGYLTPTFSQHLRERSGRIADAEMRFADSAIARVRPPSILQRARGFLTLRELRIALGLYARPHLAPRGDESADAAIFAQVLTEAQRTVGKWGGKLVLVYLPERRRFNRRLSPTAGENHDPAKVHTAVTSITHKLCLPMIDLADSFARDPDPRRFWAAMRYHYNADGYSVVATALRKHLERGTSRGTADCFQR